MTRPDIPALVEDCRTALRRVEEGTRWAYDEAEEVDVIVGLCVACRPLDVGATALPPMHCGGGGDQPAIDGVLGSGFRCSCDCRASATREDRSAKDRADAERYPDSPPLTWCAVHDCRPGTCFDLHYPEAFAK